MTYATLDRFPTHRTYKIKVHNAYDIRDRLKARGHEFHCVDKTWDVEGLTWERAMDALRELQGELDMPLVTGTSNYATFAGVANTTASPEDAKRLPELYRAMQGITVAILAGGEFRRVHEVTAAEVDDVIDEYEEFKA